MLQKIQDIKNRILKDTDSVVYNDNDPIVTELVSNDDFPFLISFPRTGSHWLRAIMELYFKRPSLRRVFYFKKIKSFTCYHTHDLTESYQISEVKRNRVIYLYRNAPDTVYSQLRYLNKDVMEIENIQIWTKLYAKHLNKWLLEEKYSRDKIFIAYEKMQCEIESEFAKICEYFGEKLNQERLKIVLGSISKEKIKSKTKHDHQVINLSKNYEQERKIFIDKFESKIWNILWQENKDLKAFFNFS